MAQSSDPQRTFRLYVTHVGGEGRFLKISGQLDQQSSLLVESLLETARENLEKGIGAVSLGAIHEGVICAAKYKDGAYYRAKIISVANLGSTGLVGVHFIDFGNKDIISLSTVRLLDNYDPMLQQLRGQATDYYLSRLMHVSETWDEPLLLKLQSLLCYSEYIATVEAHLKSCPIISILFKEYDLSTYLVSNRFGIPLPVLRQKVLLLQMTKNQQSNQSPTLLRPGPLDYTKRASVLINQNAPNLASAMCLNQNVTLPYMNYPIHGVNQSLVVNKSPRTMTNLRASEGQLRHTPPIAAPLALTPPTTPTGNKPVSPKKSITYKSRLLEVNSQHKVYVFAEDGPELFAVQLVNDTKKLQDMMDDINKRPHSSLSEPPMIGTVCLGRMKDDRIICRAIVMNVSESNCKLFSVDFGFTEVVSYYDIFDIPEEFVKPNIFAMRFRLSGVKKLEKCAHLNQTFKQLVNGKILTLHVVSPEGPPLIQYGELFLENKNVFDLLMAKMKDHTQLQLKSMEILPLDSRPVVWVSYVDSCIKFYVQLFDKIDELKAVMDAVKAHCENSSSPGVLPVGAVCCAKFPDDDNWYRAIVRDTNGSKIVVAYVDYGNEQEVRMEDLRTITPDLIQLPAQAMKCALKGFENRPVETKTSKQLEMIALEKTLKAHVVGVLSTDTMIVTLVDDTDIPPLDIARKMNQLSQPRSVEPKATTSVWKEPPGTISSPEGSIPDDTRKKSFWREKSFKEERNPRDGEDFGQSGGSFPGRDNRFGQQNDDYQSNDRGRNFRQDRESLFRPDNRGERHDCGDKKEGWNQKREFRDNRFETPDRNDRNGRGDRNYSGDRHDGNDRGDRGNRSNFSPRDRADEFDRSQNSDNNKRSERSLRWDRKLHPGGAPPYILRGKSTQVQYKELVDPLPLETPFTKPTVEIGSQKEVSVAWFTSPENFYTQILNLQPKFLEMMQKIPELYKGVKSFNGNVPVGASVLARFPTDGMLYRATVVSVQPFSKFIVRYVDYGNKQLVDAKDIWQMDRQLMELPKMAVHCSLTGVGPKGGEWKSDPEIDFCFNAPRYQCIFQDCVEDQFKVSLCNNGISVADMLLEKQLAIMSKSQSLVTVKDAAMDLTILVGQQMLCRVTHVESLEIFYVQLDLDKASLIESAIANLDVTELTPLIDVHFMVKHDGKMYRAILNVSDLANVQVVLPDFGNVIATSIDSLMVLPPELGVHYYQSLVCCLNNYTPESSTLLTIDELKTKLTGNKFIIYVNDVDGSTVLSTLYDPVSGQKIAIFEPDDGAYDEVAQLCTRAVFDYDFGNSYISHIENLDELYLQKAADRDRIALLSEELYKYYEEGTPEPIESVEVDALCAAKSADGKWYRATVISSEEEQVKVQFSDFGNSETVAKDAIKKLDLKFFEPCCLALGASLELMALQEDAITKLTEWTNEKEVKVTLAFGSEGWLANLNLDGVDLSAKLINEKLAAPHVTTEEIPEGYKPEQAPFIEPISLPDGCSQVYITHIDSPGQFWLQMLNKVEKIDEIQTELQASAATYTGIDTREMGTLCVAQYSVNDQWYRAEILDSDSDIITIRFIDYGNTDVLDNQPGLIKVIPDHLKVIERFAIKASLNALPAGTGQWSETASVYFTQLVGDLSAPVDALVVLKDVTTYVDIFVNGQSLTDKLVSEGHATRSEESVCGNYPACFISHVNSPSEFWIQLESAAPELLSMETAMVDAENFPKLTSKEEGVLCAAKYPEDGAWYRAQVVVDGCEGTEVLFMDYGNVSIVSELRSLPGKLQSNTALSRKCTLQKPPHVKAWSRKSEVKFNELAAEGVTIFNVKFVAAGDISVVDLFLEGKSVSDELADLCEEHLSSERPMPVSQDLHSSGKICYINSLEEFYMHLDDSSANLDKVTQRLSDAEDFEAVGELKVGSTYAAFWRDDETWYRGKILELCEVGYHVQFIDYGNKAKCEDLKQLPEDIAEIEPMAKCCCLSGFASDANESARFKLEDFEAELVTFQIEFLDSSKEPSLVRLLLNGTDISCILKSDSQVPKIENEDIVEQRKEIDKSIVDQKEHKNASEVDDKKQVKEMEQQIEQLVENAVEQKEVKESLVQDLVEQSIAERKETVDERIVEQKNLVKESAVEQKKETQKFVTEQLGQLVDRVIIQKEDKEVTSKQPVLKEKTD